MKVFTRPLWGVAALAAAALAPGWGCTTGAVVDDRCAQECASQGDRCEAIIGSKWQDEGNCYERNQLAACGIPSFEPEFVFVSIAPDDSCWAFANRAHPQGWSVDSDVPYACPPLSEPGNVRCE